MTKRAFIVTDLAFGDSGKGTTVDYLVRRFGAHTVIRHNGGAQAGHNIALEDGTHHTFSQFGAGTLAGARTYLSHHMALHPGAMMVESKYLEKCGVKNPMRLVVVDPEALIITPFHQSSNRLRELARGAARHGTCGVGVGEAVGDSYAHPGDTVHFKDLLDPGSLVDKLRRVQERKLAEFDGVTGLSNQFLEELGNLRHFNFEDYLWSLKSFIRSGIQMGSPLILSDILHSDGTVVFEGAQGVLLDEWHGAHPHTTYSNCTHDNALGLLLDAGYRGEVTRLGVLRTYMTRHGQGPFPTEDAKCQRPEPHNHPKGWQGSFRWGHFDATLANYAIAACGGIDGLVLTHLDCIQGWTPSVSYQNVAGERFNTLPANHDRVENGYQEGIKPLWDSFTPVYLTLQEPTIGNVVDTVGSLLNTKVVIGSQGPTPEDKESYDFE